MGYAPRPPPPLGGPAAFEWVADVLLWLCQRCGVSGCGWMVDCPVEGGCDPCLRAEQLAALSQISTSPPTHPPTRLPKDRQAQELGLQREPTDTEQQRVAFLTALGSAFFTRTRTRLPLRRLYRAGGSAVRELLHLAASLREAAAAGPPPPGPPPAAHLQQDGAALRQLAQRVSASGAQLVAALSSAPAAAAGVEEAHAATADVAALQARLEGEMEQARQQAAALEEEVAALGEEAQVLEGAPA